MASVGVDANVGGRARPDLRELRLLEIRHDPEVVGDDGEELLARLDEHALFHRPARGAAGLGRGDRGVGEPQRRLVQPLARRLEIGFRHALRGNRVVQLLPCDEPACEEGIHPLRIRPRALRLDLGRPHLRARLLGRRFVIARVDPQQHVARADALVVRHIELDDLATDLGADMDDARLDERVVGGHATARVQPIGDAGGEEDETQHRGGEQHATAAAQWLRRRRGHRGAVRREIDGLRAYGGHDGRNAAGHVPLGPRSSRRPGAASE